MNREEPCRGVVWTCPENACAEGALECGGLTPPFRYSDGRGAPWEVQDGVKTPPFRHRVGRGGLWGSQGGVKPPHSKALRAYACLA